MISKTPKLVNCGIYYASSLPENLAPWNGKVDDEVSSLPENLAGLGHVGTDSSTTNTNTAPTHRPQRRREALSLWTKYRACNVTNLAEGFSDNRRPQRPACLSRVVWR